MYLLYGFHIPIIFKDQDRVLEECGDNALANLSEEKKELFKVVDFIEKLEGKCFLYLLKSFFKLKKKEKRCYYHYNVQIYIMIKFYHIFF